MRLIKHADGTYSLLNMTSAEMMYLQLDLVRRHRARLIVEEPGLPEPPAAAAERTPQEQAERAGEAVSYVASEFVKGFLFGGPVRRKRR